MSGLEVVVGLVIVVGLVGVVVPVMPGSVLIVGAVLVWASEVGGSRAWLVFSLVTALVALGAVVKYAVPSRRLSTAGVPRSTLLLGGVVGVVGFFVVPVLGLVLGFVLGVYLAELRRLGSHQRAWPATTAALRAVGLSILIELTAALLAALVWLGGVAWI